MPGPLINSALFFQICSVLCCALLCFAARRNSSRPSSSLPLGFFQFLAWGSWVPLGKNLSVSSSQVTHASSPESNLAAQSFLIWSVRNFHFPREKICSFQKLNLNPLRILCLVHFQWRESLFLNPVAVVAALEAESVPA